MEEEKQPSIALEQEELDVFRYEADGKPIYREFRFSSSFRFMLGLWVIFMVSIVGYWSRMSL